AWMVTEYVDGDPPSFRAERNPYYWKIDPAGRQLPYIDEVVFYAVGGPERMRTLALEGRIDMQTRHMDTVLGKDLAEIEKIGGYRSIAMMPSNSNTFPLALNLTHPDPEKRSLFASRDFRVALSLAIDRPAMIHAPRGGGRPSQVAPRPASRF